MPEDRLFVFVDHPLPAPIRLVVGFAGLCRWRPVPAEPLDIKEVENRCRCGEDPEVAAKRRLTEYERFLRRRCGIPPEDEENYTMVSRLSTRIHAWKLDQKFAPNFEINSNEMKVVGD